MLKGLTRKDPYHISLRGYHYYTCYIYISCARFYVCVLSKWVTRWHRYYIFYFASILHHRIKQITHITVNKSTLFIQIVMYTADVTYSVTDINNVTCPVSDIIHCSDMYTDSNTSTM